ncbi:unnamed protein product [Larinioides sclopetarius]|uniref:Uncharacterized protein n=1 Tax=Larinioides sclopetarius TaxID=280406 RepID=A0AAV1YUU8_9ARAC
MVPKHDKYFSNRERQIALNAIDPVPSTSSEYKFHYRIFVFTLLQNLRLDNNPPDSNTSEDIKTLIRQTRAHSEAQLRSLYKNDEFLDVFTKRTFAVNFKKSSGIGKTILSGQTDTTNDRRISGHET